MITRASRFSIIAALVGGLSHVVPPSKSDRREESGLITARHFDDGRLVVDDDLPTLTSHLSFDSPSQFTKHKVAELDILLSEGERKELAREGVRYRSLMTKPSLEVDPITQAEIESGMAIWAAESGELV